MTVDSMAIATCLHMVIYVHIAEQYTDIPMSIYTHKTNACFKPAADKSVSYQILNKILDALYLASTRECEALRLRLPPT